MLRNKEVRLFWAVFAAITLSAAAAGFFLQPAAGFLVLGAAAAFGAAFFVFLRARYCRLAHLAAQIDLVLHNEDRVFTAGLEEGELSILESEITKLTLRLREQNTALRQEKSHLADSLADIAHQLRTPLTSANLILSLLKKEPDEARRRALIRENEVLFAQMDRLVTSLLKLSRLDAGVIVFHNRHTTVCALIQDAARALAVPMDLHDITLNLDIPPDAALNGDAAWLSEAVQNLLKNCMESAGDHGTITVKCEDNPLFTEITLHDSGPGFAADELPHLFDRFYRGKSTSATGYGIGLALCKSILTRQGGTITAKNHLQGGALFVLHFAK